MLKKLAIFFEKLVDPYPAELPSYSSKNLASFVWECCYGLKKYILAMTLFSLLFGSVEACIFALLGHVVDNLSIMSPQNLWENHSLSIILLFTCIALAPSTVAVLTLFKFQVIQGNFPMRLRWDFHRIVLNKDPQFFHDEFSGGIAARLMQTALAIRDIVVSLQETLVYISIYFITSAVVLASFDFWLLLPFTVWLALFIIVSKYFLPRLTQVANDQASARSKITGRISDTYTNINTVKLFSHSSREANYIKSSMEDFMISAHGQNRLVSGFDWSTYVLSMALVFSNGALSLWLWSRGLVGPGVVAASTAMSLRFNSISKWSMWVVSGLFEQIGTAQDGMKMLTSPPKINDPVNGNKLIVKSGRIEFKDVCFAYHPNSPVLDNLKLTISPGERVGLVGRSGAGKSTIINLLLRFYDVNRGSIQIDGQDIKEATQDSLRAKIGMVAQDTSLLHRSIKENILYGRPDATEEDMVVAATHAEAHSFISSLEDFSDMKGYDIHVGERGVKLSGGQRQRISLARVFLKNAPILLLDEATSSLDSEIETAIQRSLYTLMEGKTVLAIAHRLSTIAAMDRLIVLDKGKIIEEGSHEELIRKGGIYAQFWEHQVGGFISDGSYNPLTQIA